MLELLGRQVTAFAILRRDAFPAGRDDTWWRLELALQLRAISDRAYDAGGVYAGRDFDDAAAARAVREQVVALLAATKDAPIDLRRIMRKIDYLTQTIASGATPGGETPFWHLGRADSDLISTGQDIVPGSPPDPGPKPEQNSD